VWILPRKRYIDYTSKMKYQRKIIILTMAV
jgi:hypothetical protein